MFKNKKAFTLTEMIIVIVIIWILMMWTTIYLEWSDETRKIIEAQWCATTIWGLMNNYVFYSLTSKSLRKNNEAISPDFYQISLSGCNAQGLCDKFIFSYSTGESSNIFETHSISDTCNTNKKKLKVYWTWWMTSNATIIMNKWFSPVNLYNPNTFYISWASIEPMWEIILAFCNDKNCSSYKDVSEWVVDWRSQNIYVRNCAFYYEEDKNSCKTREGCKVYDDTDVTKCLEY